MPSAWADAELPVVVVTATRTEQAAYDVPASVDVVEIESERDAAGVNLSEVLGLVPGVLARNRGNYAQDEQVSIRGFGARSTFGVRGVRLYVDGIPATMPDGQGQVSHFHFGTAERVEILRGPFSALYGNSSGGVIELFTADGGDPARVDLGLVGAGHGFSRVSANARGAAGVFDYNVGVTHFQTDGWRAHSEVRRESGNAKLGWTIGDGARLTLVANALSIPEAKDPLGLTHEQFDADPDQVASVAELYATRKSVRQQQLGAIWEQTLAAGHSLRLLAYGGQREIEQFLSVPVGAQGNPLHSGGVIDLGSDYAGSDLRWTWRGELAAKRFELTAGLSADRQRQHRLGFENFIGDVLGVRGALRRDEIDTVRNADQYVQASWRFVDAWSLNAGLRHSEVRFDARDRYVTAANPDDSGRVEHAATTPVAGLLWRAHPRAHLYASWGKGFETPTFSELGYRADGGAGLAFDLDPARSDNAEIGAKLRPSDRIEANLALFEADTRDEIGVASSAGGRTTYRNIGKARRRGVEAAMSMQLARDWNLQLAWTRLDARFRTGFLACEGTPCTEPDVPVAAAARIPGTPSSMLAVALRHGGESGWRASVQGDYVSDVVVDDLGSDAAPAHAVFGASVGYAFGLEAGRMDAFARIDNLFDHRHVGSVIVNDGNGRWFEPAAGRTLVVGVDWRWAR
ncbi:MAG: TonB-dependent receptor [Lysobacteraceae bacterium]|nr:MAG: TonB-dependent receptor [Xanthomonadaceae bacterium]